MRFLFLIAYLLIAAGGCTSSKTIPVEIDYSDLPHYPTLDIIVNGEGPFKVLVDTGSAISSISPDVLEQIHLSGKDLSVNKVSRVNRIEEVNVTQVAYVTIEGTDIKRKTRFVVGTPEDAGTYLQGVIGLDLLLGSSIINYPDQNTLVLTMPNKAYECDLLSERSACHNQNTQLPKISAKLGGKELALILDTGNQSDKPFIFLKNDLNNLIWEKYRHFSPNGDKKEFSNKPHKFLRTRDFTFNRNEDCWAEFILRDPSDSSPYRSKPEALLGWNVIKDVAFKIDFENNTVEYPSKNCPYTKLNALGIWRFIITDDREEAMVPFVELGSPAYRAGLKSGDYLQRIQLESGEILEKFDERFFQTADQHVYAKDSQWIKIDAKRDDGEELQFDVQLHSPVFLPMDLIE